MDGSQITVMETRHEINFSTVTKQPPPATVK